MVKKAQSGGIDLMIATMIFGIGIIIFLVYSTNTPSENADVIDQLYQEGNVLSEAILSPGNPENWSYDSVDEIGILTNNKIDEEKLEVFYNLSLNNYTFTKSKFNIFYDYYFVIEDNVTIGGNEIEGIGKLGFNLSDIQSENLIKISRFGIYREKPVNINIYVFD